MKGVGTGAGQQSRGVVVFPPPGFVGDFEKTFYEDDGESNDYATYPDFLTRIERERPELNTFAVLDWPPLGTTDSGGPLVSDTIDVKINFDGGYALAGDRSGFQTLTFARDSFVRTSDGNLPSACSRIVPLQ